MFHANMAIHIPCRVISIECLQTLPAIMNTTHRTLDVAAAFGFLYWSVTTWTSLHSSIRPVGREKALCSLLSLCHCLFCTSNGWVCRGAARWTDDEEARRTLDFRCARTVHRCWWSTDGNAWCSVYLRTVPCGAVLVDLGAFVNVSLEGGSQEREEMLGVE